MRLIINVIGFLFVVCANAQGYTSYSTGNTTNVDVTPTFGITLMGGATENDQASRWFLERANGGDVLVLRASGSDGYNDYFYSELGISVNSVETIVIHDASGALEPYVLDKIANAEAIWFAGGDQWNYVSYFRNNQVEVLLNEHVNVKQGSVGGTSAGMAILGQYYFSAQNGTVTSAQAIADPFDAKVALGYSDFIEIPLLENTITDTHFDSPDRRGRLMAFLARMVVDQNIHSRAIASEEYVAVCIDADGEARVFGGFPEFQDFAYFAQANCVDDFEPEDCSPNNSLIWDRAGEAVKVYKVPGTAAGANTFNVIDWATGTGGEWINWSVANSTLQTSESQNPDCDLLVVGDTAFAKALSVYPNPAQSEIYVNIEPITNYTIYNVLGETVLVGVLGSNKIIDVDRLVAGVYFLKIAQHTSVVRFVKKVGF